MSRAETLDALLGRLSFALDGRIFTVPEHPVTVWMAALLDGGPDAIVPRLLAAPDESYLYERLLDEQPLDLGLCESIGLWVLEQVAGRPWWEAQRALLWALDNWNIFDAWARSEAGIDPLSLPMRSFCNLFVRFSVIATGEEREQWVAAFEASPMGDAQSMERRPEWADEAVESDFAEALGDFMQLGGGLPD